MQHVNLILVFLISISIPPISANASVNSCRELFALTQESEAPFISEALAVESNRLNPQFLKDSDSLESLYLRLRTEHRLYENMNDVFPDSLKQRLKENYSERFNLPPDAGLRIFYVNALQGLYAKVAWAWKKNQVEKIIGETLSGKSLHTAQILMDSIYSPMRFGGDMHPNSDIAAFFQSEKWADFPWVDVLIVAKRFHEQDIAFYEFHKWIETQKDLPQLPSGVKETLMVSLAREITPTYCCRSFGSPCLSCPANLKWDKKNTLK